MVSKVKKTQPKPRKDMTPQQKFASTAGAAWRSLTVDQKSKFNNNYMAFVSKCRKHKDHLKLSAPALKDHACK